MVKRSLVGVGLCLIACGGAACFGGGSDAGPGRNDLGGALSDATAPPDAPAASLTFAPAKQALHVARGSSATLGVQVEGFSGAISLTATGLPSGVTVDPLTLVAGQTLAALTFRASASATLGGALVTVTATGPSQTSTGSLQLVVQDASGSLDQTFGTAGRVVLPIGSGDQNVGPSGLAIQKDGGILLCGNARTPTAISNVTLARLTETGVLDPGFGQGGVALALTNGSSADVCFSMVALPTGTIAIGGFSTPAGAANGAHAFLSGRFTSTGAPDTGFGSGAGLVTTRFGATDAKVASVAPKPDGNPLYGGFGGGGTAFAAYLPDGGLDPNFGGSGNGTLVSMSPAGVGGVTWLAAQSSGNVVAAVAFATFLVQRYSPTGVQDAAFAGGHQTGFDVGGHGSSVATVVLAQPNDALIVAGSAKGASGSNDVAVARLSADGQFDTTFGGAGWALAHFAAGDAATSAAAVQGDGAIVVVGQTPSVAGKAFSIVRFSPNGSLDSTFGTGGRETFEIGGIAQAVAVDDLGRIVVAGRIPVTDGTRDSSVVLYRLWP